MRYTLTVREDQRAALVALLSGDGKEHACYVTCSVVAVHEDPWTGSGLRRFLVRGVIPIDDVVSNSESHVTWRTDSLVNLAAACEREGLTIFVAHSHPEGAESFSPVDDETERRLFSYILDKLGTPGIGGSLLVSADRSFTGRVWLGDPLRTEPINLVATIGDRWAFETLDSAPDRDALHRQAIVLGRNFNRLVAGLRVGVVGCGATGSATAMLLARLGFGQLLLLDEDVVDVTNLNRLHGATQSDADAGRRKAEVLRDAIAALGLGCKVRALSRFAEDSAARDAIRSCDIIFSCTDDHLGRAILNRLAYFYEIPVIDVGVALIPRKDAIGFLHAEGRVTVVQPGSLCLFCRDVLSSRKMQADATKRSDPEAFERLKAEGYIVGGGDPSPAVVTFTTEIASMGLNEAIHRLTGFRGTDGHANQRYRHFLDSEDSTTGDDPGSGCRLCGRDGLWGLGDSEPFLQLVL